MGTTVGIFFHAFKWWPSARTVAFMWLIPGRRIESVDGRKEGGRDQDVIIPPK